ncbi:uncharacterized protein LOC111712770 isoform X3 [Eurytemora carolleeae]|nr:uncharacterized protein LOC111712770 isoform X3 [Eurytemora carolleeae]|eukprot:XP_023343261.1 uncharacterized protein LOC111712770 isoform X3 [Eurytemora affinis]
MILGKDDIPASSDFTKKPNIKEKEIIKSEVQDRFNAEAQAPDEDLLPKEKMTHEEMVKFINGRRAILRKRARKTPLKDKIETKDKQIMERNIKMHEKIKTKQKELKENNVVEGRKNEMEDKRNNNVGVGRKNIVDDSEEIKVKHDKGVLNSRFKHFPVSNLGFISTRKETSFERPNQYSQPTTLSPYSGAQPENHLSSDQLVLPENPDQLVLPGDPDQLIPHWDTDQLVLQGDYDELILNGNTDQLVHQGNPDKLALQGDQDQLVLQGYPNQFVLHGDPDQSVLHENPDTLILKGHPNQPVIQRNPDQIVLQGYPDQLGLQGKPDQLTLQGYPDQLGLQGKPDQLTLQGYPDQLGPQGKPDQLTLQGNHDQRVLDQISLEKDDYRLENGDNLYQPNTREKNPLNRDENYSKTSSRSSPSLKQPIQNTEKTTDDNGNILNKINLFRKLPSQYPTNQLQPSENHFLEPALDDTRITHLEPAIDYDNFGTETSTQKKNVLSGSFSNLQLHNNDQNNKKLMVLEDSFRSTSSSREVEESLKLISTFLQDREREHSLPLTIDHKGVIRFISPENELSEPPSGPTEYFYTDIYDFSLRRTDESKDFEIYEDLTNDLPTSYHSYDAVPQQEKVIDQNTEDNPGEQEPNTQFDQEDRVDQRANQEEETEDLGRSPRFNKKETININLNRPRDSRPLAHQETSNPVQRVQISNIGSVFTQAGEVFLPKKNPQITSKKSTSTLGWNWTNFTPALETNNDGSYTLFTFL